MTTDLRTQIEAALQSFADAPLRSASTNLLKTLGYQSDKTIDLDASPEAFLAEFDKRDRKLRKDKAMFENWKSIDLLFQITDDEVRNVGEQDTLDFGTEYAPENYQSYLFFALNLTKGHFTRTNIADITREINLLFDMPAMLLIRYDQNLTISVIDRRLHKRDESRDVLEKVKLIKDIRIADPHRAHLEILHDLSLSALYKKYQFANFNELHEAWRETLDIKELNRQFYRRIQRWFFMAVQEVEFPHGGIDNATLRNRTALIRMLTRIVFCWFAKEKDLLPELLFESKSISKLLKDFDPKSAKDGTYYKAILQNLFFPTLSVPRDKRKFRTENRFQGKNKHYMKPEYYRYQDLFCDSANLERVFNDIPFLNGGLFECLDTGTCAEDEIRVDGFSDIEKNQPNVPNRLFFDQKMEADIGEALNLNNSGVTVDGLFPILNAYKFTVSENTPIEEEIALDPELLGRIFENLLAEYNPETQKPASKETGSFYTPRPIVDYMVDTSMKAYLKQVLCDKLSFSEEDADIGLDILFRYTEKEHPFTEKEKMALIDAIHDITILDPACGSGAFLMGILQKLVYILRKLDYRHDHWKGKILADTRPEMKEETRKLLNSSTAEHNWKLGIIQSCIYGIDVQPIAVQIAKLRCFISLLVDFKVDEQAGNKVVRALPNLDFKFVAADTLISPPGTKGRSTRGELSLEDKFFNRFAQFTEEYFFVQDPKQKKDLRNKIKNLLTQKITEKEKAIARHKGEGHADKAIRDALQKKNKKLIDRLERDIQLWDSYHNIFVYKNQPVAFFDTPYFFPELYKGFDIVIGNPPYRRIQKYPKPKKNEWKQQNFSTYDSNGDIYCLFFERGLELLKAGGNFCYITSNKWMRADYGKNARKYFTQHTNPRLLVDFGGYKVFDAVTVDTAILLAQKSNNANNLMACRVEPDFKKDDDIGNYFNENRISLQNLSNSSWLILTEEEQKIKDKIEAVGTPLQNWNIQIYRGILTGCNRAFIIDGAKKDEFIAADPKSAEIIKPVLRGREINRYKSHFADKWLINTHNGYVRSNGIRVPPVNVKQDYSAIWSYFQQINEEMDGKVENRCDKGVHWTNLRNCAYIEEFEKEKIIYGQFRKGEFAYDSNKLYLSSNEYLIVGTNTEYQQRLKFLLAALNSKLAYYYASLIMNSLSGNTTIAQKSIFTSLPIAIINKTQQLPFENLVDQIIEKKKVGHETNALERQIDHMVYDLYGLTAEEKAIVEGAPQQ